MVNATGQAVQQCGFTRTRAARNQNIAAHAANDFKNYGTFGCDRLELGEISEPETVFPEFTNCQGATINRQRRRNDVDTRAIRQTRVANWACFIDAAANLADDALADVQKLSIVAEAHAGLLHLAINFDEHCIGTIDHDVGDVIAG